MKPYHPLILVFVISLGFLFIGQRFGFEWAGGRGYSPPRLAELLAIEEQDNETMDVFIRTSDSVKEPVPAFVKRGQTLETENGRAIVQISETTIALDERTKLEFLVLENDVISVRFPKGRIYIDRTNAEGVMRVFTNRTVSTFTKGRASFVNYDFRETVSIIPINSVIEVLTSLDGLAEDTHVPVDIHETNPVERKIFDFHIQEGTGAEFYAWAQGLLHTPDQEQQF